MAKRPYNKIADILLKKGVVSQEDIDKAVSIQEHSPPNNRRRFSQRLVEDLGMDPEAIYGTLSVLFGFRRVDFPQKGFEYKQIEFIHDMLDRLPGKKYDYFIQRYTLPLEEDENDKNTLVVVSTDLSRAVANSLVTQLGYKNFVHVYMSLKDLQLLISKVQLFRRLKSLLRDVSRSLGETHVMSCLFDPTYGLIAMIREEQWQIEISACISEVVEFIATGEIDTRPDGEGTAVSLHCGFGLLVHCLEMETWHLSLVQDFDKVDLLELSLKSTKDRLLETVDSLKQYPSYKSKTGERFIQLGQITRAQRDKALQTQQEQGQQKRLGEILLDLGYITKEQLGLVLKEMDTSA